MITDEQFLELTQKLDSLLAEKDNSFSVKKTMDANGRITVPKSIRQMLDWEGENVEVEICVNGKNILLKRVDK
jgi:AbrB family looped-hinge helix DNA binding protein